MSVKIDKLEKQLAKANERARELEKELKESEDDLDAAEQQLSSYENALEEVQAVFVDSDACPLFEPFNPRNLSAWLNKFAIEKKIDGVQLVIDALASKVMLDTLIGFVINSVVEQLRKEQEQ
jgi:DNA repair exonuclease SbcCD ATPase subunit